MPLLSLEDLSRELSVSCDFLKDCIAKNILIPYGGRARLGEPVFSSTKISEIRAKILDSKDS